MNIPSVKKYLIITEGIQHLEYLLYVDFE